MQFPAGADPGAGPFEGRVEHVASGQVGRFHNLEELRAFVAQVLAGVRAGGAAASPDPPGGGG